MWSTKRAETREEIAEALRIRQRVFVEEQEIPPELDRDGRDADAHHLLVFDGTVPVATGRVRVDGELAEAARIAVLPGWRGRGVGRRVVLGLEEIARAEGASRIVLHPHAYLERFYAGLGYARAPGETSVGAHRLLTMGKALP